jgi:hypothetical protein
MTKTVLILASEFGLAVTVVCLVLYLIFAYG